MHVQYAWYYYKLALLRAYIMQTPGYVDFVELINKYYLKLSNIGLL